MIPEIAGLALPCAAAWRVIDRWDPPGHRGLFWFLGHAASALIVGIGVASVWTFLWLLLGGVFGPWFLAADVVLWLGIALAVRGRGSRVPRSKPGEGLPFALLVLGLVALSWNFHRITGASPHGDWDAWGIWNVRAAFLFRSGADWKSTFVTGSFALHHPEYPLLLPLSVARLWAYGSEGPLAPALIASSFGLALPALAAWHGRRVAGPTAGALVGLLVIGTPRMAYVSAFQLADVPLAAYLVAGCGALLGVPSRRVVVAGLCLGFAGWTKNEGVVAAVVAACTFWLVMRRSDPGAARSWASRVLLGGALPAGAWIAFHLFVTPHVILDFEPAANLGTLDKLIDPGRWREVVLGVGRLFPGISTWYPAVALIAVALHGLTPRALLRSVPFLLSVAMSAVYFLAFLITPRDLGWHLDTAAPRLWLQLWPLALLGLVTAVERDELAQTAAGLR